MWDNLTWRALHSSSAADDIKALREDTLRLFLVLTAVGYLTWHFVSLALQANLHGLSASHDPRYWVLLPIVLVNLFVAHVLQQRSFGVAAGYYLVSSALSITAAIVLFGLTTPTFLYLLTALVATVLVNPLSGLTISLMSVALLLGLRAAGPLAFITADQLTEIAISLIAVVVAAWALGRDTVIAAEWALNSYSQALRNTREAQDQRAQLVQALKQLDIAYYRLQQANGALEVARRSAEAAEHSKSEFVANISHELRTPLNLIVGFSEMVVTSPESYGAPLPAAYRLDLTAIYHSAQHLLALTEDVLDLERIGTLGRMSLALQPTDLRSVIEDACSIIRGYVAAKGLGLRIAIPSDLPIVSVDSLRIRQVLLNLLTNAARFTETGGVEVTASLEVGRVRIKVVDTGRGIPPVDLPTVFDEFHHGDPGLSDLSRSDHGEPESLLQRGRLGGAGLGLSLSRRLVQLHRGQIGVESTVGMGTTFWFTLPTGASSVVAADGHLPRSARSPYASAPGGRTLVLAGGTSQVAQFLQHHLRGFRIIAAPDVHRAAATALECNAAAILADTSAAVPDAPEQIPLPVFRLPLPHDDRMASALGAAAYLTKPVAWAQLRAVIGQVGCSVGTVLIVDDDTQFVQLMARMFLRAIEPAECVVLTASNGRQALALMETNRPDLVLLDLMMPVFGGREVLAAMAENPQLSGVPVIVVSAVEQEEEWPRLQGLVSVSTPGGFRLHELLGAVEALLGAVTPPWPHLDGEDAEQVPAGEL